MYEGWTNKETWAVNVAITTNRGLYEYILDEEKRLREKGKDVVDLEDFIKGIFSDMQDRVIVSDCTEQEIRIITDIGSLHRVNWREIAKSIWGGGYI